MKPEAITILGATGSVGRNTLDLIERMPDRFTVEAVTANSNARELAAIAIRHEARFAAIADPECHSELKEALAGTGIEAGSGPQALIDAAERPASRVMAAIVGAAGLAPTLAAVRRGATLLLANKECLVCAGTFFMETARNAGATILPVDSEHSAVFQALETRQADAVDMVTLTASGGPFRDWPLERLARARPEEAVRHPNWSMGAKISVDSASLMNKGLELIEAHHLFDMPAEKLEVLVHPESIVHGLVAYVDGAVIAQLAPPDMRTPIAFSLGWPDRVGAPTARLDLAALGRLSFETPDLDRFPALEVARSALAAGGRATAILNAANEVAVDAYLKSQISFLDMARIVQNVLEAMAGELSGDPTSLEDALQLDSHGRARALEQISPRLVRAV